MRMSDKVTVKVLLNQTRAPYANTDRLYPAIVFDTGFPASGGIDRLLHIIRCQLDIGEPQADWAIKYHAEGNRSLSVGDVIVVGEQAFTCCRVGHVRSSTAGYFFRPVTVAADQIVGSWVP
jgi:hypothetical protein